MTRSQYELVYIAAPEATEQQLAELHEQVDASHAPSSTGTIDKHRELGPPPARLRRSAGTRKAIYVLEVINGGGELMKELDRRLKVFDLVIRHLVVRVDEEQPSRARAKAQRQATSARRRVARGLPPERQPEERRASAAMADDRDEVEAYWRS